MTDTSWILRALLASPGAGWGPVVGAVTVADAAVLLLVAAGVVRGWRLGLSRVALGAGGLLGGALAGLWAASHLVPTAVSPLASAGLQVGFVVAGALIGSGAGAAVGWRAAALLDAVHLRLPDRAAGAVARGALALALCWLLTAGVAALAPPAASAVATAVSGRSALLRAADGLTPSLGALGRRVTADVPLAGDLVAMVPLSDDQAMADQPGGVQLASLTAAAAPSTVRVRGAGCGGVVTGSGFVAAEHLVVTNAHVVAGTSGLTVTDQRGAHRAVPVLVDTGEDLAVLRVEDRLADPLALEEDTVATGTSGVVLGYPGGGPLDAEPAVVTAHLPLRLTTTAGAPTGSGVVGVGGEYRLATTVLPGNSGGPVLGTDGQVVAVVNARSLSDADVGYAIPSPEVASVLADAAGATTAVATGTCGAGAGVSR